MSEDQAPRRLSVKALQAKLGQNGGGIPMPQIPGGGAPPLPRALPPRPAPAAMVDSSQSEPNLLRSEDADNEFDGFARKESAMEDSMNSVALSKPTIAAGRRRPSRVPNLAAQIPEENRLNAKDVEMMQALQQDNKRDQSSRAVGGPRGEEWILAQLAAMEQNFMARLQHLEEENAILRQALLDAGTPIPACISTGVAGYIPSTYQARFTEPVASAATTAAAAEEPPAKKVAEPEPVANNKEEEVAEEESVAAAAVDSRNTAGRKPPAPPSATSPSSQAGAAAPSFSKPPPPATPKRTPEPEQPQIVEAAVAAAAPVEKQDEEASADVAPEQEKNEPAVPDVATDVAAAENDREEEDDDDDDGMDLL